MTRGKKVPTAERARAVGIAAVSSIAEASRVTGYSEAGIHAWYHSPEYEELRNRKKEIAEQEWSVGIQLAFRRAVVLLDKTDDPVKAATTGAIMFDKLALSTGNATSRTETKDISGDIPDHIKRDLRARFADSVSDSPEAVEAEGPQESTATEG